MTPRAIEETKSNKRTDESFDFPETSDMCDFGYVLAAPADSAGSARADEHSVLEIASAPTGCRSRRQSAIDPAKSMMSGSSRTAGHDQAAGSD